MATIFSEDFESGTNGATVTTSNTGFSSVDAGWTFSSSSPAPIHGSLAGKIATAPATNGVVTKTFTAKGLVFCRFYVYITGYPVGASAVVHLALSKAAGTNQGQLRVNSSGNLVVRDGSNSLWTSPSILPLNQWVRIEWMLDGTNHLQQAKVFTGASVDSLTASMDSGTVTLTTATNTTDEIRVGLSSNTSTAALTYYYDAVVDDDAAWPGPANPASSVGTASANWSVTATAIGAGSGVLWEEKFESGSNGAAITTANAQFASVDAGCTFVSTPTPAEGLLGAQVSAAISTTVTMVRQFGSPQALRYYRFYLRLPSYPGSANGISFLKAAGTTIASLRVNTTGTLALRDGSTTRWTSTALPTNEWMRVEVKVDTTNTALEVRLFTGQNLHGTTPDQDSGNQTLTAGNPDQVSFGISNGAAAAWSLYLDAVADANNSWVGPTSGGNSNPAVGWNEDFEAGTAGTALSTANTGFDAVDPGWEFVSFPTPAQGSLAAQLTVATDSLRMLTRQRGTASLYFYRFYLYLTSYPATANGISFFKSNGSVIGSLRITTSGGLALRDGSTTRWTSAALPLNQWVRVEGKVDTPNLQLQTKLFIGMNVHGTIADRDSGTQTLTSGNLDQMTIGCDNGSLASWTLLLDSVAESVSTWVGPATGGNTPPNAAWATYSANAIAAGQFVVPTTPELLARPAQIVPNATFTTAWLQPTPANNTTFDMRGSQFQGYFFADAIFGFGTFSDGNGGTTASAHQKNITPIYIGGTTAATGAAVIGGVVTGDQDTTLTWEDMKHGTPTQNALDAGTPADTVYNSVIIGNQNQDGDPRVYVANGSWAVFDGIRCYNTHDGIGLGGTASSIASDTGRVWMRNVWIYENHDDAIENDLSYLQLNVNDCLFENCYSFISTRAGVTAGTPDTGKTQVVSNSIISLMPRGGPHKQPSTVFAHGHMYKFQGNSPGLNVSNTIYAVSAPATTECVTLPERPGIDSYSNVTIIWTGGGAYPGNVPAGCTVTTDSSILDRAVANWKRRHGVTDFNTVDMSLMIAPSTNSLLLGINAINMNVGSNPVSKVYAGSTQIWP